MSTTTNPPATRPAHYTGSMRRLDSLLLCGVGVLLAHQIAYMASAFLDYETSVAHGHLALAWLGGSIAALVALASRITNSLKSRNHAPAAASSLTAWIASGYLVLEQFERVLDGHGTFALFSEPVFWLGILAAPLVAIALRWSVRAAERLAIFVVRDSRSTPWPRTTAAPFGTGCKGVGSIPSQLASVVSRRGPPAHQVV